MKQIFLYLCLFTLFFTCSSDDENSINTESNFYGLKIGNSWNYKVYEMSSQTQNLEYNGINRDITVIGIEEINGYNFFKLKTITSGSTNNHITFPNGESVDYRRVEDGALLDENDNVIFVNNNFSERLVKENDYGNIYNQTLDQLTTVTVDAGTFSCVEMLVYVKSPEGDQFPGFNHTYYSEGIGLVSYSISFLATGEIVNKVVLNSYNINN